MHQSFCNWHLPENHSCMSLSLASRGGGVREEGEEEEEEEEGGWGGEEGGSTRWKFLR